MIFAQYVITTIFKATERRNICNTSEVIPLWKSYLKRQMELRNEVRGIYESMNALMAIIC